MLLVLWICSIFASSSYTLPLSSHTANTSTLRFLHVVWRHGDRAPENALRTVPDYWNKWTTPNGELTPKGIQEQYMLGRFIRERYADFLSKSYSSFEVYIRSSNYNRTIMSAQANLAGLFPINSTDALVDPNVLWNPIPIHVVPRKIDNLLVLTDKCPCPNEEEELEKNFHTAIPLEAMRRHEDTINLAKNMTGLTCKDVNDCWKIHDIFLAELSHNISWPAWLTEERWEALREISNLSFSTRFRSEKMLRLRSSPLFDDIVKRLEGHQRQTLDHRLKYYAYSGHDMTIAALLEILGAHNDIHPPYAAAVFLELHKMPQSEDFFLEVWYRNDSTNQIYQLPATRCSQPLRCALSELRQISLRYLSDDWEKECGLTSTPSAEDTNMELKVVCGILIAIGVLLLLTTAVQFLKIRRLRREIALAEQCPINASSITLPEKLSD